MRYRITGSVYLVARFDETVEARSKDTAEAAVRMIMERRWGARANKIDASLNDVSVESSYANELTQA
jgi:hypothetical protein